VIAASKVNVEIADLTYRPGDEISSDATIAASTGPLPERVRQCGAGVARKMRTMGLLNTNCQMTAAGIVCERLTELTIDAVD